MQLQAVSRLGRETLVKSADYMCLGEPHRLPHFFNALCEIVANNQVNKKICGFYDGFTLIFD